MTATDFIRGMEGGLFPSAALYEYFRKGEFSPADILEAYRVKDSPRFLAKVQSFAAGSLFAAQTGNFDQHIEGALRQEDKQRAWEYLSVEESAQQRHKDIHLFIQCRIYHSLPSQKDLENLGYREKLRDLWVKQNDINGWGWR